jgi:hypothetical protein
MSRHRRLHSPGFGVAHGARPRFLFLPRVTRRRVCNEQRSSRIEARQVDPACHQARQELRCPRHESNMRTRFRN